MILSEPTFRQAVVLKGGVSIHSEDVYEVTVILGVLRSQLFVSFLVSSLACRILSAPSCQIECICICSPLSVYKPSSPFASVTLVVTSIQRQNLCPQSVGLFVGGALGGVDGAWVGDAEGIGLGDGLGIDDGA